MLREEGRYYCSERTTYRLLAAAGETAERRAPRQHPRYAAPPERFVRQPPMPPRLPTAVWITAPNPLVIEGVRQSMPLTRVAKLLTGSDSLATNEARRYMTAAFPHVAASIN